MSTIPNPTQQVKIVACPQCGGPSPYANHNPFRPFCSARCKGIDLGAWASERFALPESVPNSDPAFERD